MTNLKPSKMVPKTIKIERFDENGNLIDIKELELEENKEGKYKIKEVD